MKAIIDASSDVLSKEVSVKNIVITILYLILGVALVWIATTYFTDKTSAMYLTIIFLGVLSLIVFVVRLVRGSSVLVYRNTKSEIVCQSLLFKSESVENVINAIETGKFNALKEMVSSTQSGVRLDVVKSKDHGFAACQVFRYVPHNYEPASSIYRIEPQHLTAFCSTATGIYDMQSK